MKTVAKFSEAARAAVLDGAKDVFHQFRLAEINGDYNHLWVPRSLDGYAQLSVQFEQDYRVTENFWTTPQSSYTLQTILILFENSPVWWMTCAGECRSEGVAFLQEALAANYRTGEFRAGRGDSVYKPADLGYMNSALFTSFSNFSGHDQVCRITNGSSQILSLHDFSGHSFI